MLSFRFLLRLFRLLSGFGCKNRTFTKQKTTLHSILDQKNTIIATWHIIMQTGHKKETVWLSIERTTSLEHNNNKKEKSTNKVNKCMQTIRLNSTGADVKALQELLNEWGYPINIDGIFGQKTHEAVCRFQKSKHLTPDGCVGQKTWLALQNAETLAMKEIRLEEADFQKAAEILNVEVAAIKAVQEVETGGKGGFLKKEFPAILFEGHIFWNELKKRNIQPEKLVYGNEDILYPKWTKSYYKGGIAEYERLQRAIAIHEEAANCSASWGMFQIMGFNYSLCGCESVDLFVSEMKKSEGTQLLLFTTFLRKNGWDKYLRQHDWAEFARHYNGPSYKDNKYDEKIENAYNKYL